MSESLSNQEITRTPQELLSLFQGLAQINQDNAHVTIGTELVDPTVKDQNQRVSPLDQIRLRIEEGQTPEGKSVITLDKRHPRSNIWKDITEVTFTKEDEVVVSGVWSSFPGEDQTPEVFERETRKLSKDEVTALYNKYDKPYVTDAEFLHIHKDAIAAEEALDAERNALFNATAAKQAKEERHKVSLADRVDDWLVGSPIMERILSNSFLNAIERKLFRDDDRR